MSAINSLLKYRFTKKTDKLQCDVKSGNSEESCANDSGHVTPEPNSAALAECDNVLISEDILQTNPFPTEPSVVSESPKSLQSNPSPLISKKGSVDSTLPNGSLDKSSDVDREDDSGQSSGPWLSKKTGSLLNGFNDALLKKKKVSHLSFGRQRLKSDSESSSEEEDVDDSDQELPSNDDRDSKRKREVSLSQGDLESPVIVVKRRRVQLLSDSSEELGVSSQDTVTDIPEPEDNQVQRLREVFPAATVEKIKAVLLENDCDVEKATDILLTEDSRDAVSGKVADSENKIQTLVNGVSAKSQQDEEESFSAEEDDSDQEEERSERGPVLSFFETATAEELAAMPGCSKKRAEIILGMRPFKTWENLVTKFQSTKALSYTLITRCWEIIQIREVVIRLMQRCEKISQQLGTTVTSLADHVTLEDMEGQITCQPKNLNPSMQMKPYQLVGLNWLRLMHTQELNGILADEMGLGKTVQAISFLSYLLEEGDDGPHVVVVPSSTVENWLREMTTWSPSLQVVLYYGSQEERRRLRKEILYDGSTEYNVLLTTYNMTSGSPEDRSVFKSLQFHYAVFDEGHMLKNMTSQRYQHLQKIRAHRRLLLTGTPLQNNLLELMSLLCFVMPDMFVGKTESLKRMFTMITKNDEGRGMYEKERIAHAKNIMKPFVLRRLKRDVLDQLPRKVEKVEHCPMVPEQQVLYDRLVDNFSKKYMEKDKDNLSSGDSGGGAGMVMQLRKLANHPLLIRHYYTDHKLQEMAEKIAKEPSHRDRGALPHIILEDMQVMSDFELHSLCKAYKKYLGDFVLDSSLLENSGKFGFLTRFLEEKIKKGDRVLLFSQFTMMLDVIEEFIKLHKYKYLRLDGQTPVIERQQMIDEYNQNKDLFLFLLSTRAGGLGINLTAANVVVLHDIDFNPYNDKQAEDRCHRVGQTRSVEVVKLISKGTVEEGMLSCATYKLNLEKDITAADTDDQENPSDVLSLLKNVLGQHLKEEQKKSTSDDTGTLSV